MNDLLIKNFTEKIIELKENEKKTEKVNKIIIQKILSQVFYNFNVHQKKKSFIILFDNQNEIQDVTLADENKLYELHCYKDIITTNQIDEILKSLNLTNLITLKLSFYKYSKFISIFMNEYIVIGVEIHLT